MHTTTVSKYMPSAHAYDTQKRLMDMDHTCSHNGTCIKQGQALSNTIQYYFNESHSYVRTREVVDQTEYGPRIRSTTSSFQHGNLRSTKFLSFCAGRQIVYLIDKAKNQLILIGLTCIAHISTIT